jgi:hypothetical protein
MDARDAELLAQMAPANKRLKAAASMIVGDGNQQFSCSLCDFDTLVSRQDHRNLIG